VNNFKRSDYNILVRLFLKNPDKINYPKEYALAKKLLSSYGDFSFWKGTLLESKYGVLNSLAYFLTEEGKYFLKNSYFYHQKRKDVKIGLLTNDSIPLEEKKVEKDLNRTTTKKISLLDFIKNDS
tara:strand:+ start:1866 stop:2240 length:375 start_codon:yes stop_codon:yes gene_type:complete